MLTNARILLRKHAPGLAYFIKTLMKGPPGVSRSPEETFSAIYSSGTWGNDGDEPYSVAVRRRCERSFRGSAAPCDVDKK